MEEGSQQSPEEAPIAAAAVHLPKFSTTAAVAWFQRAEVQFRLKRITASHTKADYVLAAIPEEIFPRLSNWLQQRGDTVEYEDLKQELLKKFTSSPEERANTLLDMVNLPLGDERPSEALDEMLQLAEMPSTTMQKLNVTIVLWLTRLPDVVRQGITKFAEKSPEDLGDLANSLMATYRRSQPSSRVCAAETSSDEEAEAAAATNVSPRRQRYQRKQPAQRRSKPPPSVYRQQPPRQDAICQYHARFGPKAFKCKAPCAWPKNV